jgi:diguanylate cyclase (GGDEF)-like protein
LTLDLVEAEIGKFRGKIFAMETGKGFEENDAESLNELQESLVGACQNVKKITDALTDDFYPISNELKVKAGSMRIDCHADITPTEIEDSTTVFLSYIDGLKGKISTDFKHINSTFLTLLEHVKKLEKDLTSEFDGDARQKEMDQFETKVHGEVGSIVDSFNIHATIDEIKSIVVEKLAKIKSLLSQRKKEEMKRFRKAQRNINTLKKRIATAERDAGEMIKKVKHFEAAATKDGLTGLYNRNAFDSRMKTALKAFDEDGEPFSIVLIDVDDFKNINDTLGHVSGDKVLKKVAECLQETFRKNDCIARFGGDEFAVVLEGLSEEIARKKIMAFKEKFTKKRFFARDVGDIKVSISAGFAQALAGESVDDILHRADMDMYSYKKQKH